MGRRNFLLRLNKAIDTVFEAATNPQSVAGSGGGTDPSQADPALAQQQQNAERQATNQVNTDQQNNKQNQDDQKIQRDKQQQTQQNTQLSIKMADFDKKIAQLQSKIQAGATKPTDLNQLTQLLTAKKAVQDQFMKLNGVNPGA